MIYVIGDVHLRFEEPFFSVTEEFLNDLIEMVNEYDTLIFTGDFFHRSRPYSEELCVARKFFERLKQKIVYVMILAGNHEYFRDRDTWAEDMFNSFDIDFIEWPVGGMNHGSQFLFLPWMPLRRILNLQLPAKDIKEYYEGQLNKYMSQVNTDLPLYVIYHFEDETVFMGGSGIGVDLSPLENKLGKNVIRLGGHIHNPSKNYIGAPYATRSDETGFDRHIVKIDPKTQKWERLPVRQKIEFKTLMYDELNGYEFDPVVRYVIKVLDAPSIDAIKECIKTYKNVWLDDYELKFNEQRTIIDDKDDLIMSVRDFLNAYIKQNKLDPKTANYLLSIF